MSTNTSKEAMAVSVNDRLRDAARKMKGDPNLNSQFIQSRYVYERLLARLARTAFADRWVLKGGVLMLALPEAAHRVTMDIDWSVSRGPELSVGACLREICSMEADPEDGLSFELATEGKDALRAIREEAGNPTVRGKLIANLHLPRPNDRRFTVDVTGAELDFEPVLRQWTPTIRGFEPITVRAYPWEMVLAEKLHSVMTGTLANPRLRDYMDVIALNASGQVDMQTAAGALERTFESRGDQSKQHGEIVGLSPAFAAGRQADWEGTLKRTGYGTTMPASLAEAIEQVRAVADSLVNPSAPVPGPR